MGKNTTIEEVGNLIGNTVAHKILARKTNKPESTNSVEAEEIEYRAQAAKKSKEYNWNRLDISQIKQKALKKVISKFESKYKDIKITKEEVEKLIQDEIDKILID